MTMRVGVISLADRLAEHALRRTDRGINACHHCRVYGRPQRTSLRAVGNLDGHVHYIGKHLNHKGRLTLDTAYGHQATRHHAEP